MRARGRPVLGAIAGLFLGAFVAVDLQQFGIRPLDNISVFGLPALGLILGLALGFWGPMRRARARPGEPPESSQDAPAG